MPAFPQEATARPDFLLTTNPPRSETAPLPSSADVQEIKDRLKELETRERQGFSLWVEAQRKTIDWWLNFLAFMAAIVAVLGALIPFLMARKDKEFIESERAQVKELANEVRGMAEQIRGDQVAAGQATEQIKIKLAEAQTTLEHFQSGKPSDAKEVEKTQEAVAAVQQDPTADVALKLRAAAITASEANDAEKAYALWRALTELKPDDDGAQFNAGYWAQELAEKCQGGEARAAYAKAAKHYEKCLQANPAQHQAAYNWGIALEDEAKALAPTDLAAARKLWRQAGEKYQQALTIKPDEPDTAYNWGSALDDEANALAPTDLAAARKLWRQAGEKYQQALTIKPDESDAAFSWGSALDDEAKALAPTDLAAARELWQRAGEKYQQALTIKPDTHDAANNWGIALDDEANALAPTDLAAARELWQQAGEKYQQALTIKPDYHMAAHNWAIALRAHADAIAATDETQAIRLRARADEVLKDHPED